MYCGCPLPGDTIGQKLRCLLSSQAASNVPSVPPKTDARAAMHPNDHNVVFTLHNMSANLRRRENRACKTGVRRLRAERNGRAVKKDGNVDHAIACLYPVPMFHYYLGGSVTATGVVVNGSLRSAAVSIIAVFGE